MAGIRLQEECREQKVGVSERQYEGSRKGRRKIKFHRSIQSYMTGGRSEPRLTASSR